MADRDDSIGERTALMFMMPADEISQRIKKAHHEWLAALDTIRGSGLSTLRVRHCVEKVVNDAVGEQDGQRGVIPNGVCAERNPSDAGIIFNVRRDFPQHFPSSD